MIRKKKVFCVLSLMVLHLSVGSGCSEPTPIVKDKDKKGSDIHLKAGKGTNVTEPNVDLKIPPG